MKLKKNDIVSAIGGHFLRIVSSIHETHYLIMLIIIIIIIIIIISATTRRHSCFSASLSHFNGSMRYSYTSLLSHPTSSRTSSHSNVF